LRLKNSEKLCEGKKKVHDGKEVLYMQKVDVYMEDELVPHIYVKDANISDVMMDKEEDTMNDEPESINVTSCNYFLSILFILVLLYGLFSKWKIRGQPTKKQSRRYFHGLHNKKTLKTSHALYDEVSARNQSSSILTSHKLVNVPSNAGAKLLEGNYKQKLAWEVVSHRKRNFNYWYGPIKPGDLYSDS
jgi:hypothetical protein